MSTLHGVYSFVKWDAAPPVFVSPEGDVEEPDHAIERIGSDYTEEELDEEIEDDDAELPF